MSTHSQDPSDPSVTTRRRFFGQAIGLTAGAALLDNASAAPAAAPAATTATAPSADAFAHVSAFLTGRQDLDVTTAERMALAFSHTDPTFADRLSALAQAIDAAGLKDMSSFDTSAVGQDANLRKTAVEIVSAWYTGTVGHGPHAQLFAYHDALQYQVTRDVTTVPTYAMGGVGYWAKKPD